MRVFDFHRNQFSFFHTYFHFEFTFHLERLNFYNGNTFIILYITFLELFILYRIGVFYTFPSIVTYILRHVK